MNGLKLRQRLLAGERLGMINPHHSSPTLASRLTELGADMIFVDCEHGSWSYDDVRVTGLTVRGAGGSIIVRPQSHDRSTIVRYLNVGADGIMVPMVANAAEAAAIVETVRYACPGDYDQRLVVCMIESAETVHQELDAMLEVEGVDVFFIGPNDLAQSMGHLPYTTYGLAAPAEVEDTVQIALAKIKAAGRVGGTLVSDNTVERWMSDGASFIYYHADPFAKAGIAQFQGKLAATA
jgi:2-keto-3-deoxy-L-rhamnonate aldolase RhmA